MRNKIAEQTAEYLARGGTITQVDSTENHAYREEKKRKRQEQIDYMKRTGNTIKYNR
jgi:hypothetical protein